MPFVLIVLGLLFLIVAVRGTQDNFFWLLKSEFTGANSFPVWILALLILGAIGFIKPARPVAHAMMALVLLVIVLTNGTGFFDRLNAAFRNPTAPTPATPPGLTGAIPAFTGGSDSARIGGVPLTPGEARAMDPATAPGGVPAPSPAFPLLPGTL